MHRESIMSASPASSLHLASDEDDKQPPAAAFYTPPAAAAFAEHAANLAYSHMQKSKVTAGTSTNHARQGRLQRKGIREGSNIVLVDTESMHGAVVTLEQYTGGHFTPEVPVKDSFWPCTFNLSKVIMGAGMMAIPKALMLLGLLPGLGIMVLMAALTFFTLAGLVSASSSTGMGAGTSYGALVRRTVGATADKTLQVSVFSTCWVMNVVFVVVVGDILVGNPPDYRGLLPELLSISPADCWYLGRPLLLGTLSLLILLPLSSMRSMERLAVVNIIGVASNGVFAGLLLALAACAASNGVLKMPALLPDLPSLGSSPVMIAVALASIVPVLLNCDVCHQSLHPLMPLLQPYSVPRMQRVVATALGMCNVLYVTVALCSGLVFGAELDADVLTNISAGSMGPLIGPVAAVIMANLVRFGYLMSLIGSYVLLCYPLRQCLGDLLLSGQGAVQHHWSLLTVTLVGSTYLVACYLPSIWGALSIVGATMSTVQGFIIPALVVLAVEHKAAKQAAADQHIRIRGATTGTSSSSSMSLLDSSSTLLSPLLSLPAGGMPSRVLPGEQTKSASNRSSHLHGSAGCSSAAAPDVAAAAVTSAPASLPAQQCGLHARRVMRQLTAAFVLLLGIALFVNGIVDHLLGYFHPTEEGESGNVAGRTTTTSMPAIWRQLLQPPL